MDLFVNPRQMFPTMTDVEKNALKPITFFGIGDLDSEDDFAPDQDTIPRVGFLVTLGFTEEPQTDEEIKEFPSVEAITIDDDVFKHIKITSTLEN